MHIAFSQGRLLLPKVHECVIDWELNAFYKPLGADAYLMHKSAQTNQLPNEYNGINMLAILKALSSREPQGP